MRAAPSFEPAFRLSFGVFMAMVMLGSGCDGDPAAPLPGHIAQPAAAVDVDDKLFVASPPADGIKVLDLGDEQTPFIRAPNPLFALEVPAVRRPTVLHPVPSDGEGRRSVVIALSSLDPQLRVLDVEGLVPLGSPVALPGRPVAVDHDPSEDLLYVVVARPEGEAHPSALVTVALTPGVRSLEGGVSSDESPAASIDVLPLEAVPGGIVASDAGGSATVWISDVSAPRVLRVDAATSAVEEIETEVPLSKMVASNDAAPDSVEAANGRVIYALTSDREGLLALDASEGAVLDAHVFEDGVRPMPLPSLGVSLTTAPRLFIDVGEGEDVRPVLVPLLLMVSTVDGGVLYFDGTTMTPVDVFGRTQPEPSVTMSPPGAYPDEAGDGLEIDYGSPVLETVENPDYVPGEDEPALLPLVDLTPGVARARTWGVSWRREIPGLSPALGRLEDDLPDGEVRVVPTSRVDLGDERVLPGDLLSVSAEGTSNGAACAPFEDVEPLMWEILSVDPSDGGMTLSALEDGPPLPAPECFDDSFVFRLRAGGYMVRADGVDELWRIEPGETFEYEGARFMHTDAQEPGPEIRFTLAESQDELAMEMGAERRLEVCGGLEPISARPDTAGLQIERATIIGQPAAHRQDRDTYGSGRLFVPYAGPGYLISFDIRTRGAQRVHR